MKYNTKTLVTIFSMILIMNLVSGELFAEVPLQDSKEKYIQNWLDTTVKKFGVDGKVVLTLDKFQNEEGTYTANDLVAIKEIVSAVFITLLPYRQYILQSTRTINIKIRPTVYDYWWGDETEILKRNEDNSLEFVIDWKPIKKGEKPIEVSQDLFIDLTGAVEEIYLERPVYSEDLSNEEIEVIVEKWWKKKLDDWRVVGTQVVLADFNPKKTITNDEFQDLLNLINSFHLELSQFLFKDECLNNEDKMVVFRLKHKIWHPSLDQSPPRAYDIPLKKPNRFGWGSYELSNITRLRNFLQDQFGECELPSNKTFFNIGGHIQKSGKIRSPYPFLESIVEALVDKEDDEREKDEIYIRDSEDVFGFGNEEYIEMTQKYDLKNRNLDLQTKKALQAALIQASYANEHLNDYLLLHGDINDLRDYYGGINTSLYCTAIVGAMILGGAGGAFLAVGSSMPALIESTFVVLAAIQVLAIDKILTVTLRSMFPQYRSIQMNRDEVEVEQGLQIIKAVSSSGRALEEIIIQMQDSGQIENAIKQVSIIYRYLISTVDIMVEDVTKGGLTTQFDNLPFGTGDYEYANLHSKAIEAKKMLYHAEVNTLVQISVKLFEISEEK